MKPNGKYQMEDSRSRQVIGYGLDDAQQYFHKHRMDFFHRLSTWREQEIARHALAFAGDPHVVIDLPCGAGRF